MPFLRPLRPSWLSGALADDSLLPAWNELPSDAQYIFEAMARLEFQEVRALSTVDQSLVVALACHLDAVPALSHRIVQYLGRAEMREPEIQFKDGYRQARICVSLPPKAIRIRSRLPSSGCNLAAHCGRAQSQTRRGICPVVLRR